MAQEAQGREQILTPSEPTAPSSSGTPENWQSRSETTQITTQDQMENDQVERMPVLKLSTPARDRTPAEGGKDSASSDVFYTMTYNKQEGVSSHVKRMTETDFRKIKEFAAKGAFEVMKEVQMFEIPPAESGDGDKVQYVLGERILIYSPRLLKAVREVITYWPTMAFFNSISNKRLELESPYTALGAYREEFKGYVANIKVDIEKLKRLKQSKKRVSTINEKETISREIEQLMKEVNKYYDSLANEEALLRKKDDPMATFDMLCLHFRPGQFVYAKISGFEIACRVQALEWPVKQIDDDPSVCVILYLWYLDFNGSEIDRRLHRVSLVRFMGEHIIRDLDVYPEEYAKDRAAKRHNLEACGEKYFSLLADTASYRSYKGTLSTDSDDPYNKKKQRWYEGKVIVDPARYVRENGTSIEQSEWTDDTDTRWSQGGEQFKAFVKLDPKKPDLKPTKDHYFLAPRHIRGFTLDARDQQEWGQYKVFASMRLVNVNQPLVVFLEVDNIQPYEQNKELIDTLEIHAEDIKMIKAVTQPRQPKDFNADKVPGKGEGDIILLYGPPGTGKTYTAECIAEWSGRPLLRLTCTELGVNPNELEAKLFIFFQRAEEWNAVVLMDECDIYISRRSPQSAFEKNAIVAIFLRALDYFKGTLFLTTNHSFEIDRAIIDRVSLTVEYQKSREVRRRLCTNLKHRLWSSGYSYNVEVEDELDKIYADMHEWSGRELNTVFNLITKRADFDSRGGAEPKIDGKIVATVIKRVKDFEVAWESAHGATTMDQSMKKSGVC